MGPSKEFSFQRCTREWYNIENILHLFFLRYCRDCSSYSSISSRGVIVSRKSMLLLWRSNQSPGKVIEATNDSSSIVNEFSLAVTDFLSDMIDMVPGCCFENWWKREFLRRGLVNRTPELESFYVWLWQVMTSNCEGYLCLDFLYANIFVKR